MIVNCTKPRLGRFVRYDTARTDLQTHSYLINLVEWNKGTFTFTRLI